MHVPTDVDYCALLYTPLLVRGQYVLKRLVIEVDDANHARAPALIDPTRPDPTQHETETDTAQMRAPFSWSDECTTSRSPPSPSPAPMMPMDACPPPS